MDLPFRFEHFIWAVGLGVLSAISLPLGSVLGLIWKPPSRITAALTAFGAGALVAALTIELVAPTAQAVVETAEVAEGHAASGEAHEAAGNLLALLFTAMAGGILFVVLDQIVNARGGFLRKTATTISFLGKRRAGRHKEILQKLSNMEVLHSVPLEHIQILVDMIRPVRFHDGEVMFTQGAPGDRLYFIESGEVGLLQDGRPFKQISAGEIVGEIALLTGSPRTATAKAKGDVDTLVLWKKDFDTLRECCPELPDLVER